MERIGGFGPIPDDEELAFRTRIASMLEQSDKEVFAILNKILEGVKNEQA